MRIITPLILAVSFSATVSHAALYNRGGGMIYDSTLNITWLQDANTSGQLTWDQAQTWVDNLIYGGYTDWRLPSTGGSGSLSYLDNGQTLDLQYHYALGTATNTGIDIRNSEMGHLYYVSLNNPVGSVHSSGATPSVLTNTSFVDAGSGLVYQFLNVESSWLLGNNPSLDSGWVFNMHGGTAFCAPGYCQNAGDGTQYNTGLGTWVGTPFSSPYYVAYTHQVWAVRDGDVAQQPVVPIPAAAWLLGSGLLGLAGASRLGPAKKTRHDR